MKYDWKQMEKQFYLPKTEPELVKIPVFKFFSVKGQGNPNDKFFADYISVLYSLSYAIKMSLKYRATPEGFFDYAIYPLEGIWDISEEAKIQPSGKPDKNSFVFNLMIRQPDFLTNDFASEIIEQTKKKKPHTLLHKVRFEVFNEGHCVQMMHIGSYDNETDSFKKMEDFCILNKYIRESKEHREIYLSDNRKVSPENQRTVLRYRIRM